MPVVPVMDANGLTVLRTADVLANLEEAVHASTEYGPEEPVGGDTPMGQILDPVAQEIGYTYEGIQSSYDANDPDKCEGVVLDSAAAARGLTREPATASTVRVGCSGTPATVIAAGKRVRVDDGPIFALDTEVTLGAVETQPALVYATCTVTGPEEAAAGAVKTIVDAVAGWSTATNSTDAEVGSAEETDPALRARLASSGSIGGRTTMPSLAANLRALAFVDEASVLNNRTLITDADGVPGKAFRALIWPDGLTVAQEEEIAAVVWDHVPAGIRPDGTEEYTVTTAEGDSDTVRFSYLSEQVLWWKLTVTEDTDPASAPYPTDGDALVAAAAVAYGATLDGGQDVLPIKCAAFVLAGYLGSDGVQVAGVPGIRSLVVEVRIGGNPTGHTSPIVISSTLIATTAIGDVTVVS